jgi:hypothetical protein
MPTIAMGSSTTDCTVVVVRACSWAEASPASSVRM